MAPPDQFLPGRPADVAMTNQKYINGKLLPYAESCRKMPIYYVFSLRSIFDESSIIRHNSSALSSKGENSYYCNFSEVKIFSYYNRKL